MPNLEVVWFHISEPLETLLVFWPQWLGALSLLSSSLFNQWDKHPSTHPQPF